MYHRLEGLISWLTNLYVHSSVPSIDRSHLCLVALCNLLCFNLSVDLGRQDLGFFLLLLFRGLELLHMLLVGLLYAGHGLLHWVGWLENSLSFFKLFAGPQRSIISLEFYRIIVLDYLFLEFLVVDHFVFFLPFDPH